jgi:hypothetical protein
MFEVIVIQMRVWNRFIRILLLEILNDLLDETKNKYDSFRRCS